MKGRKCPNRQDPRMGAVPACSQCGSDLWPVLTRSPLSNPVSPPAAISSSSMWGGQCHLASPETETPLHGSPLRGQAAGQRWAEVRRPPAAEPPHLVKQLLETYRQCLHYL